MDKHYLTPLFAPESIVVFAGRHDDDLGRTTLGRAVSEGLRAQRYSGTLQFVDINTSGTLADLAQTRADLAIIALPPQDVAAALEVAGRMACRSALVISSGIDVEHATELKRIAKREGVHLLGPNCLGLQRPKSQLNASAAGPLAKAGSLALVSQSGALTSSMLDWASKNAVGFSSSTSKASAASRQRGRAHPRRRDGRQRRRLRCGIAPRRGGARVFVRRAVLGGEVPRFALPAGRQGAAALAREPVLPLRVGLQRIAALDAGALHADRIRPRESIMDVARDKGLAEIDGRVLANNGSMLKLMKSLGFASKRLAEDPDFNLVTHAL